VFELYIFDLKQRAQTKVFALSSKPSKSLTTLLFLLTIKTFAQANLVTNAGFESGLQNWTNQTWSSGEVKFDLDSQHPHSGQLCLKIEHQKDNDSLEFQNVPVHGGRVYKISGWIRTLNVSGTEGETHENIGACLCIKDTWVRSENLKGNRNWKPVTFYV